MLIPTYVFTQYTLRAVGQIQLLAAGNVLLVKPAANDAAASSRLMRRENRAKEAITHYAELLKRAGEKKEIIEMLALLSKTWGT